MEVRYKICSGYLRVQVNGKWNLEYAKEEMAAIREVADKQNVSKILADVRDMAPQNSFTSRFTTGEFIARTFPPPFRLAVIDTPEFIDGIVEDVAVNRGACFAAFADEQAALSWLLTG